MQRRGMLPTPTDHRQLTTTVLLGTIALAALLMLAHGTPAAAVREVLAIIFPPLVALAAHSDRGRRK